MLPFLPKATYVFTAMTSLLLQIKQRRLALGLKQNDMRLRAGLSRQQYQRLEAKGNPRLDTLELIAMGLNSELMLIPRERLGAVMALLAQAVSEPEAEPASQAQSSVGEEARKSLAEDPWHGLLGDKA